MINPFASKASQILERSREAKSVFVKTREKLTKVNEQIESEKAVIDEKIAELQATHAGLLNEGKENTSVITKIDKILGK